MMDDFPEMPEDDDFSGFSYTLCEYHLPNGYAPLHYVMAFEASELEDFLRIGSGLGEDIDGIMADCGINEDKTVIALYTPKLREDTRIELIDHTRTVDQLDLHVGCLPDGSSLIEDNPATDNIPYNQRLILVITDDLPQDAIFLFLHTANSKPRGKDQDYEEMDSIIQYTPLELPRRIAPARPPVAAKLSKWVSKPAR